MAKGQQRISKGFYQYSQADNFITVKNYIFLKQNDKKGLLIRFVNDMPYKVDSMEYTVVQLDVNGAILGKTCIKHTAMNLLPGSMFVSDDAVAVDDRCCDFRVVFAFVRSGDYLYTVREGNVVVDYALPPRPLLSYKKNRVVDVKTFSVKRKTVKRPIISVISPLVALILSIVFIIMYISYGPAKDYNKSGNGNYAMAAREECVIEYDGYAEL